MPQKQKLRFFGSNHQPAKEFHRLRSLLN